MRPVPLAHPPPVQSNGRYPPPGARPQTLLPFLLLSEKVRTEYLVVNAGFVDIEFP
jgi:hypothetical protein